MGNASALPLLAPFFQGQAFQPLSTPWAGAFSEILSASEAAAAASLAPETYSLSVPGTLAIASDLAPKTYVLVDVTPTLLRVDLKQAPVAATLVILLSYYTTPGSPTLVATFTVADGLLFDVETTAIPVPSGAWWEVDITAVGTTFPGSDLTVTVQ